MGRAGISALIIALLGVTLPASAADPYGAEYSNDASKIFWILHISDSHIGAIGEIYDDEEHFAWALQDAVYIIQPDLIINTGDLCDGSRGLVPASGQSEDEWSLYRQVVDDSGMTVDYYIDIPGNHDLYGDPGFTYYMEWSLNGSIYGNTTRSHPLEFGFGKYFFYGCSTAGEEGPIFLEDNAFSQAELDDLQAKLTANDDSRLSLVFGHHPLHVPDKGDEAREIMKEHQAIYFHGHSHTYDEYIDNNLLTFQVNSLGKAERNNVAVIGVDNDFVSYGVTHTEDPWPLILVTAPANVRLKSEEVNPYAYPIGNTCTDNPVRALVFDAAEVTAVTARLVDGPEVALEQDPQRPMLWSGTFNASEIGEGEAQLTVTATGSQQRSRSITVLLAPDVACPEEVQPDAGVEDGDGGDGGDGDGEAGDGDVDGDGYDGGDDGGMGDDAGGGDDASVRADDAAIPADERFDEGGVASGGGCMCSDGGEPGMLWLGLLVLLIVRQRARRFPVDPRARHTG